jgi:hypothetical protein
MKLHSPKPYSEYSKPLSGSNIEYFEDDYRSCENLFRRLRSLGVSLFANGAGLGFDSPEGVITDELLSEMRAHRDDLIAEVERFEERAAVAQYDGGLIRSEAERLALSELPTKEQVVAPENFGMILSGVFCPFCRWDKFEELPHGDWRCRRCEKVAWRWLGESFVSFDVIGVDLSA